jgi:hypothetical protein
MQRLVLTAVVLGTIATCLAASTPANAAKRLPCSKKGSKTVAADEHGRVFRQAYPREDKEIIFGCLYESDRRFVIIRSEGDGGLGVRAAIAGPLTGYQFGSCIEGDCVGGVGVSDLRDGTLVRYPSSDDPRDFEVSASGALAWIEPGSGGFEVRAAEGPPCSITGSCGAGDKGVLLDAGPRIAPTSLALSGARVYWTNGGTPRSARLQGGDTPGESPRRTGQSEATCARKRSNTFKANTRARVFTKPARFGGSTLYGCLYSRDRAFVLGPVADSLSEPEGVTDDDGIAYMRLAGAFAAYSDGCVGRCGAWSDLFVRDLRTGMVKHSRQSNRADFVYLRDLELRGSGAAAWIDEVCRGCVQRPTESRTFQVNRFRAGRNAVRLDRGPDIEPDSLALSGSILYWTKGGRPYSAALN